MTTKKAEIEPVGQDAVVVEEVVTATLLPANARKGDVISQYIRSESDSDELSPEQNYQAMIDQIMASTSAEQLFAEQFTVKPADMVEKTMTVLACVFRDSEFGEGPPIYSVILFDDEETGERNVMVSGEQRMMAQLLKAQQENWLPVKVKVVQSRKPNRFGKYLHSLVMVK